MSFDLNTRSALEPLGRFLYVEAASGIALLIGAGVALVWANSPWGDTYEAFWTTPATLAFGELQWTHSLRLLVNEGLMTIFFLVVGLEVRRELHSGTLADVRVAALPVIAALGGVVVPALIYVALNLGSPAIEGWAVPTATDIAFAVGVLALLGKRVPQQLRALLLALAIMDDVAAILIIALFYSHDLHPQGVVIAAAGVALVHIMHRLRIRSILPYALPGFVVWAGIMQSGVHPTIAGVILGLLTPVDAPRPADRGARTAARAVEELRTKIRERVEDVEELAVPHRELSRAQTQLLPSVLHVQIVLHPWVAFAVIPVFALANAGISFTGLSFESVVTWRMAAGIFFGLALGKPLGIALAALVGVRLGWSSLPPGISMPGLLVMGALAGIGFTMSIFIAGLAFTDPARLEAAKFAILIASATAAAAGLIAGKFFLKRNTSK